MGSRGLLVCLGVLANHTMPCALARNEPTCENGVYMLVELPITDKDDPKFVRLVTSVVDGIVAEVQPDDLFVVAIDNWFDHKWLNFSGVGVVPFESAGFMSPEVSLGEFRQYHVTLPPFSPKRVISETHLRRQGTTYLEIDSPVLLHERKRKRSAENLNRRIGHVSASGAFVWYSSNTHVNEKASIMVYIATNGGVETWFASFRKRNGWSLHLTKGIDRGRVQELLRPLGEKGRLLTGRRPQGTHKSAI